MLKQFISSIIARFVKIEPMNAYIQKIPVDVEYPCYLVNKCDIKSSFINSYYFMNTVTLYVRIFSKDEVELKNRANNLIQNIMSERGKISVLDIDGEETDRFVRIEDIESIEIPVDENEIYCIEINFSFDTTHVVNYEEFDLLAKAHIS
jgi:hypothetical protein